jgi:hypothetical protein
LKAATYHGWNGPHTFARYVEAFQEAFNELADLGEQLVPESKKVTNFLAGISDPILHTGKDVVLGDPVKLADFTESQPHTDTCCACENMRALSFTGEQVNVSPFSETYKASTDIPIASVATGWEAWGSRTPSERHVDTVQLEVSSRKAFPKNDYCSF